MLKGEQVMVIMRLYI